MLKRNAWINVLATGAAALALPFMRSGVVHERCQRPKLFWLFSGWRAATPRTGRLRNPPRQLRKMSEHALPSTQVPRRRPRLSICTTLDTRLAVRREHIGARAEREYDVGHRRQRAQQLRSEMVRE